MESTTQQPDQRRLQSQPVRPDSRTPSQPSNSGSLMELPDMKAFAKTIAHLSAAKLTTDLTRPQIQTWFGVLSVWPNWILNRAVLEIVTSDIRFPEVGDLYQRCRAHAIKEGVFSVPYSPNGDGKEATRLTRSEVATIGSLLGLDVANPSKPRGSL